jgi:DNA-binding response OmpR family regulator
MPSSILVVEDEPAIAELIAVNLQHAGHYPIRAYNAEQALSLMSDVLPDLVLLDWMLPGKSGATFAKELRNNDRTKQIPIIMLTARRGAGQGDGPRSWRGRLCDQAVLAEGTAGPHQGGAAPPRRS